MLSRLVAKAADITKRVALSLVAPVVPCEAFDESWAFIVAAHAGLLEESAVRRQHGEPPPSGAALSPLAHHLKLLPTLLRQERSAAGADAAVMDLPCFCLLSEHAVISTLVAFAREQVIPGLAMQALAGIVHAAGPQLLSMASVHRPLRQLLAAARVTHGGVRFSDDVRDGGVSDDADGGLPLVACHAMPAAAARDVEALVKLVVKLWRCMQRSSAAVALVDAFCGEACDAATTGTATTGKRHARFVLLAVVQQLVADVSDLGTVARDCVLSMVRSRHAGVLRGVCGPSSLLHAICGTLATLLMRQCRPSSRAAAPSDGSACVRQPIRSLLVLLSFVDDLAAAARGSPAVWLPHVARGRWAVPKTSAGVVASLLPELAHSFLASLRRCLLEGSEEQLTTATCVVGAIVRHLAHRSAHSSITLSAVVVTLLGPLLDARSRPGPAAAEHLPASLPAARAAAVMAAYGASGAAASSHDASPPPPEPASAAVREALLQRVCGYMYEPLVVSTLDLFNDLISLGNPLIVQSLVICPGSANDNACAASASRQPALGCDQFLARFPQPQLLMESMADTTTKHSLQAYVSDVEARAYQRSVRTAAWRAVLAACGEPTAQLADPASKDAADSSATTDASPRRRVVAPFLRALLDLLKQSLDQSLNVNLAVAGVVCSLVADPAEPIRRALLAPLDGLSQSSLQSVLPAVWHRAMERGAKVEGFPQLLRAARCVLRQGAASPSTDTTAPSLASLPLSLQREFASQRRFLQAVVVVEETAKHVCCALHAGHDPARTPETGVSSAGARVAHVDRATPP